MLLFLCMERCLEALLAILCSRNDVLEPSLTCLMYPGRWDDGKKCCNVPPLQLVLEDVLVLVQY
jgi:hypothetical protein